MEGLHKRSRGGPRVVGRYLATKVGHTVVGGNRCESCQKLPGKNRGGGKLAQLKKNAGEKVSAAREEGK